MSKGDDSSADEGIGTKVGKGLGKFFFGDEAEHGDRKGKHADDDEPTAHAPAARTSGPHTVVASTAAPGTPDPEIRRMLEGQVTAAALPAYQAYRELDASLATVITDETTRIRAVLAGIKGKGHDLAAIDTDLGECLTALDTQLGEAEASAKKKLGERVLSKQQRINAIDAELGRLSAERAQLDGEATVARTEIEQRRSTIAATVAAYKEEIVTARQNINRIGKGG